MTHYQELSKSERLVMEVAWRLSKISNAIVLTELKGMRDWSRHTAKAYTKRLMEKGFLEEKKISKRQYFYYPLISKGDYLADEAHQYMSRNFKGLSSMVAGLISREKVSLDELDKLESIINEFKGKTDE